MPKEKTPQIGIIEVVENWIESNDLGIHDHNALINNLTDLFNEHMTDLINEHKAVIHEKIKQIGEELRNTAATPEIGNGLASIVNDIGNRFIIMNGFMFHLNE